MKRSITLTIITLLIVGSCKKNPKETVAPQLPVINKTTVSIVTDSSATFSVDITSTGISNITNKGVVVGTDSLPTIEKNFLKTSNGSGSNSFTVTLSGFSSSTKYFVRAYATNNAGTGYGNSTTFTTNSDGLPAISTLPVTDISYATAVSGILVSDSGTTPLTALGIVYGADSLPTLSHNINYIVGDPHSPHPNPWPLTIEHGLSPNTKYFVRAYATNSSGTVYGNSLSFTTKPDSTNLPIVSTDQVSATDSSAVVNGNIIYDGGFPITASGVVYSTDSLPNLSNSFNSPNTTFPNPGFFQCFLNGLPEATTYYVRAYATNNKGTSYGNQLVFQTKENTNEFHFFKDQYSDTTFALRWLISTFPHNTANFFDSLSLPNGVYFVVRIDSLYGLVKFSNNNDTTVRYLQAGDTVRIPNDGNNYSIYTPPYYDNWGNYLHDSQCWYSVIIGGTANTTDNTYYCKFNSDYYFLSNTTDWWKFYTDFRQQCDFAH